MDCQLIALTGAVTLGGNKVVNDVCVPIHTVTFNGNGFSAGATALDSRKVAFPLSADGFVQTGYNSTTTPTGCHGCSRDDSRTRTRARTGNWDFALHQVSRKQIWWNKDS